MVIVFFIFGLIIGSFLNVVIYRLQEVQTILGRSFCPHCKNKIRWYDNIPLFSYAILKTKCRDCGEKISWQYPAIELVTGILFALTAWIFFDPAMMLSWVTTVYYLGLFSMLLVIFVYDAKFMEIPMVILWMAVGWTVLYLLGYDLLVFLPGREFFDWRIFPGLISGAGAFLFFFALSYGSKERWMGMGDAYVALLVGLAVGWPGVLLALFLSFSLGSVYGILQIMMKQKTMQSQIPFAPFMVLGLFLAVFLPEIFPIIESFFWIVS